MAIIALGKGVKLIDHGKKIWVMVFCNGDIANIPNVELMILCCQERFDFL